MWANLWHYRRFIWDLAWRSASERYVGSAGGWLWALAQPALMIIAYLFLFQIVFKVRLGGSFGGLAFALFFLTGMLPWLAFSEGLARGVGSLIEAAPVLRNTVLPIETFPVRSVLGVLLVYGPVILLFDVGVALSMGTWKTLVWLPFWMFLQGLMTFVLASCLAVMAAALKDVVQGVNFVLAIGIFLAPVFFTLEQVPGAFQAVVWCNPFTPLVVGYHALLLKGEFPWVAVGVALAWVGIGGQMAHLLFERSREQVVDWL